MTLMHALVLGVVQGLTEFLPISSSGHLVLAETFLGLPLSPQDAQGLNVLLHAGTLLALLVCYASSWWEILWGTVRGDRTQIQTVTLLIAATIPGGVVGFLFDDAIALHFQSVVHVAWALMATGCILLLGEHMAKKSVNFMRMLGHTDPAHTLSLRSAFLIGLAQACALVPGLSRSGLTMSIGRMVGLKRQEALDFSFLMAVPIIAGASALLLLQMSMGTLILPSWSMAGVGVLASFMSSVAAILFLRQFVLKRSLGWFAPYLFLVGGGLLLF